MNRRNLIREACRQIAHDPEVQPLTQYRVIVRPRELYMPSLGFWVREDGSWISGWNENNEHEAFCPGFFDRMRIRRAVRRRAKLLP